MAAKLKVTLARSSVPHEELRPISKNMFGANFLFDRDKDDQNTTGSGVSKVFTAAIDRLGVTTLRYPGGTVSETLFDIKNPNSANQIINWATGNAEAFDPDRNGPMQQGTLTLTGAVSFASIKNISLSIVMPTYSFLGDTTDELGHRYENVDDGIVHGFIYHLLLEAKGYNVQIDAIELGNEWWVDNSDAFGTTMTPTEYGRIASHLARVIDATFVDFRTQNQLSENWQKPNIVVQVGPGGAAERYLETGFSTAENHNGKTVAATDFIFREFNRIDERAAVDGLVTHRYLTGSVNNADGWKYLPFDRFDQLAGSSGDYQDLHRYVSEWNVAARNESELGPHQAGALVALFSEMAFAGIDHANIWAIQQNNKSRLIENSGFTGESFGGLTAGGTIFSLMRDALTGLTPERVRDNSESLATYVYGGFGQKVIYIVNTSDVDQAFTLDPKSILIGFQYGWEAILGGYSPAVSEHSVGLKVNIKTGWDFYNNEIFSTALKPNEVAQITLVSSMGVSISGSSQNDIFHGSDYSDSLNGGDGDNIIYGGGGRDLIVGGVGQDVLIGGTEDASFDPASGQVFRLYQTALGRLPDWGGHWYHTNTLMLGTHTLDQIARTFVDSSEFRTVYGSLDNEAFVALLYSNSLHRSPDTAGLAFWNAQLENGIGRSQIILGFSESAELLAKTASNYLEFTREGHQMQWSDSVFNLYQTLLDRVPDRGGFLFWTNTLAHGAAYTDVIGAFVNSPEFQTHYGAASNHEFVNLLYTNILGRDPEPDGFSYWKHCLDFGDFSRSQIVQLFAQSVEFVTRSAPGLKSWVMSMGTDDTISDNGGDNTLFGGMLSDTFVFNGSHSGTSNVVGLEPWDVLRFDEFGYSNADDVLSHMHQVSDDVVFMDHNLQVTFLDTQLVNFDSSLILI